MQIGPSRKLTASWWGDMSIPCKKNRIKLHHQYVKFKSGAKEFVEISPFTKAGLQFGKMGRTIFFKHPRHGWIEV